MIIYYHGKTISKLSLAYLNFHKQSYQVMLDEKLDGQMLENFSRMSDCVYYVNRGKTCIIYRKKWIRNEEYKFLSELGEFIKDFSHKPYKVWKVGRAYSSRYKIFDSRWSNESKIFRII